MPLTTPIIAIKIPPLAILPGIHPIWSPSIPKRCAPRPPAKIPILEFYCVPIEYFFSNAPTIFPLNAPSNDPIIISIFDNFKD
jgi:hypothetical protein